MSLLPRNDAVLLLRMITKQVQSYSGVYQALLGPSNNSCSEVEERMKRETKTVTACKKVRSFRGQISMIYQRSLATAEVIPTRVSSGPDRLLPTEYHQLIIIGCALLMQSEQLYNEALHHHVLVFCKVI